jgi:hypothetical protein
VTFSDAAIQFGPGLWVLFGLALRRMIGMGTSVLNMAGLEAQRPGRTSRSAPSWRMESGGGHPPLSLGRTERGGAGSRAT